MIEHPSRRFRRRRALDPFRLGIASLLAVVAVLYGLLVAGAVAESCARGWLP